MRITEAQIRKVIREELVKVLNEQLEDKGPQLSRLHFQERQDMAQYAKDESGRCLEGHNQNNGQYAVVTGCKYYYLSAQNIQLMKSGQHHNETFNRIESLLKDLGLSKQISSLPVRYE